MNFSIKLFFTGFLLLPLTVFTQTIKIGDGDSADRIFKHTSVLAADSLFGRGTGSRGEKIAEKYIIDYLISKGIPPVSGKSWFQSIPLQGYTVLDNSELNVASISEHKLKLNSDYVITNSGTETLIPSYIETAFAGYGITAPEYDYDDYFEIDVEGKMVIVIDGEPYSTDKSYFLGEEASVYSLIESKLRIALSKGAAGVIIIPVEGRSGGAVEWDKIKSDYQFEEIYLSSRMSSGFGAIINPASAKVFFEGSGVSVDDIYTMVFENKVRSFYLPAKIEFKGKFISREFISHNIAAAIENLNTEEWVILTAHFDHLGVGKPVKGDSIYNGLNDNALGVAVLLEIAAGLVERKSSLNKNVLILFLSAEEKGLLGSKYYTSNPLIPLVNSSFVLNIDGVPFIDEPGSFEVIDGDHSDLRAYFEKFAKINGIKLDENEEQISHKFIRGDHYSFVQAGIPSFLIQEGRLPVNKPLEEYTWLKYFYTSNIYHSPFDDLHQFINYDAAAGFAKILLNFILFMDKEVDSPKMKRESPYYSEYLKLRRTN